ncbi:MAG: hypothetical protein HUK02_09870, partial [Bacteroidaceae bacterium]|nr:hypothetical protein [Bacteroidaceae bacterium]
VDSDDWVEPHMIEHLVAKAEAEQADMVICDYLYVTRTKEEHISQRVIDTDHFRVLQQLFQGLHGSCCNKLVRRSAILQYGAIFPTGVYYCEDVYFNASLLVHPVKVAYLPEALYHYDAVINPSSLVKKYNAQTYRHDQQLLALFQDLLDQPRWEKNMWPTARAGLSLLVVKRMFCRGRFTHKEFYELGQQYLDGCTGNYRWKIRLFLQLLRWKMYLPLKQLYALK